MPTRARPVDRPVPRGHTSPDEQARGKLGAWTALLPRLPARRSPTTLSPGKRGPAKPTTELPFELRRPLGPRDPGDAWVEGDRGRFWGRFGSAGLLVHDPAKGILLQHRALWSDQGGTWGLPGGALHQGEEAVHGALREAKEEAAVPPENVRVLFTSVFDVGYWTYTTVAVEVVDAFEPEISDPESLELQWVPVELSATRSCIPDSEPPGRACAADSWGSTPGRTEPTTRAGRQQRKAAFRTGTVRPKVRL